MIYTVTLNPSIDFIVRIDKVEIGEVNRMESDDKFAGGKGINVSRILQRLGVDNTATGFIGGFTGRFVTDGLDAEGIKTKFVAVDQDTRINVKIKADQETEINGAGPVINEYQLAELEAVLSSVSADDVVVFAGSAPSNLGNKVYNKMIPLVRETGAQVVCDFEGQTLLDSLAYQPLLVKPRNQARFVLQSHRQPVHPFHALVESICYRPYFQDCLVLIQQKQPHHRHLHLKELLPIQPIDTH